METLDLLLGGFATALQLHNLLLAIGGCILGMLVGVLPGLGPAAGTALLIPLTYTLGPTSAIILLAAIYYGCQYGGTITSVLVNIPGEASSAITCIDGHEMARRGRAGAALSIAAYGSFIGGTFATIGLVLLAQPLSSLGLTFGPPELFALMLVGMTLVVALAGNSIIRAAQMGFLGILIGCIGLDPVAGVPRFTFGWPELLDGMNLIPVAMGLFGISEVLSDIEAGFHKGHREGIGSMRLTREDVRRSVGPIGRGTIIGFLAGIIPGVGAITATILSYGLEKRLSKRPSEFGKGAIEGVAGPETANNAWANATLIPLLTLGIPGSTAVAILMGALLMNDVTPGPLLFANHPDVVWPIIASLYIGNVVLVILNVPLIPVWVSILKIDSKILYPVILAFCIIGAYSINNSVFDIYLMLGWGLAGYVFRKLDMPLPPLLLTFVLGPVLEASMRRSLVMSQGDWSIFVSRPISVFLIVGAVVVLLALALLKARTPRVVSE